jgi:glutamate-ammonia-ligase adenylyltransferase
MASTLAGFEAYQVEHAWTWEHLALTRARVICADEGMAAEVTAAIERVLGARHDVAKTLADVADMRGRLSRDRKAANEFDLKLVEGGLIDLEFIAQTAQLIHRAVIASPQATTVQVLERLAETGILADATRLAEIHRFYTTVLQMMSACLLKPLDLSTWTDGFREILLRATYTPSMTRLESDLREMRGEVAAAFEKFIGAPKA